jgi:hypothetical protein
MNACQLIPTFVQINLDGQYVYVHCEKTARLSMPVNERWHLEK